MSRFIDNVISEFGESLGLSELELNDQGSLVLSIGRIGVLSIDRLDVYPLVVLVTLSRRVDPMETDTLLKVLEISHYRSRGRPIHVGLNSQSDLFFSTSFGESDFTLSELHHVIEMLDAAHASMEPYVLTH